MNTGEFRAAVTQMVEEWLAEFYPKTSFVTENSPVPDQAVISSPWIDMGLRWFGSTSLGIGEVKKERHFGAISVMVFTRCGTGPAESDRIIDGLQPVLAKRRIGSAIVRSGARVTPTEIAGWHKEGLLFPFTLDV